MLSVSSPSSAGQATTPVTPARDDAPLSSSQQNDSTDPQDANLPATKTAGGDSTSASSTAGAAVAAAIRKRKPTIGGRGVANLTPEQLAKKRANDREAQRNIRERTKAQIENLERTIEQLKSQQPYQELQRVVREKEAVETELAEVKRVLATVLGLIQPHVAAASMDPRGCQGDVPLHRVSAHTGLTSTSVPRAGYHHDQFMTNVDANAAPLSSTSATYSMPWQTHGSDNSPASQNQPPAFAPRPRSPNGQPTLLGMASSIYRLTENEQEALTQFRLDAPRDQTRSSSATPLPGYGSMSNLSALTSSQPFDENAPLWTLPPLNTKVTCTLDTICLTFLTDLEKRVRQGAPVDQVVGGDQPDWQFIADPDTSREPMVGALSRFFGQVLSNRMFPDLQKPAEKIGTAYLLYTSGYWHVSRRREDYERIPEWLRPGRKQLTIPHGPWVDAMFWPKMRDRVMTSPGEYVFDELFIPLTRTVGCSWPYGEEGIFDPSSSTLRLSVHFLQHIRRLENWTLGPEFARAYPSLEGTYNLRTTET